jgi:hypothetical protein
MGTWGSGFNSSEEEEEVLEEESDSAPDWSPSRSILPLEAVQEKSGLGRLYEDQHNRLEGHIH